MQAKIVPVAGIGPVVLRRNRRARRLTLRISPGKPVTLTLPYVISAKAALAFLEAHRDWARQMMEKNKTHRPPAVIVDGTKPVQTRAHRLELHPAEGENIRISVRSGLIRIQYPADEPVTSPRVQEGIAQGLIAAYRNEANQYLPKRVKELAGRYGFYYHRVAIKNLRSRWGSCSAANNINLNLHLMRLSDDLIDYVILHELTHTRVKNHSPAFWRELQKFLPDAKEKRKQLRFRTRSGLLDSVLIGL